MRLKQRKNLVPFIFHAQTALCIPVHLTQVSEALCGHRGDSSGAPQTLKGHHMEMLVEVNRELQMGSFQAVPAGILVSLLFGVVRNIYLIILLQQIYPATPQSTP